MRNSVSMPFPPPPSSPLSCLSPSQHRSQFASLVSKTGKRQQFLFFLGKQEQRLWSKNLKLLHIGRHRYRLITVTLNCKGAALKIRNKKWHYNKYKHSLSIDDDTQTLLVRKIKVWPYDTPIASTMSVYAAWVSLSRPTTVRTIPSLKPTLNLPSWFPPVNIEHKLSAHLSETCIYIHTPQLHFNSRHVLIHMGKC